MNAGERVVHAGELHRGGLPEAEPRALGLLGVGETGVDGKDERRVPGLRSRAAKGSGLHGGSQKALPRGPPRLLRDKAREPRRLEARAVLGEAIARERELGGVRTLRPGCHAGIGLEDGLSGEATMRARLVQLVDARVDLASHGITGHGERAADSGGMRGPGHRVKGRGSKERQAGAAGKALRSGDPNAHARERARAAAGENGVNVGHREPGVSKRRLCRAHELHVGSAPAQMVARGEQRNGTVRTNAPNGAGQHVRGRVNGEDGLLGRVAHSGLFSLGVSTSPV